MFRIMRERPFQISLCIALVLHGIVLFRAKSSSLSLTSEISIAHSESKLRLMMKERVIKKSPPKKRKLAKKPQKAMTDKEDFVKQEVNESQAAIMKTKNNKESMHTPKPRYPRMAIKRGIEGRVVIKILINEDGLPYDALVIKSSGHKVLDEAALNTAMQWKFSPALVEGKRVKSQNHQPFVFSLQNI